LTCFVEREGYHWDFAALGSRSYVRSITGNRQWIPTAHASGIMLSETKYTLIVNYLKVLFL